MEDTIRLREEIASLLEHEKDERGEYFTKNTPAKWMPPSPITRCGDLSAFTATLSTPSTSSQVPPSATPKGRSSSATIRSGDLTLTPAAEEEEPSECRPDIVCW